MPACIRPYRSGDLDATVDLWHRTWHHTFPSLTHPQAYAQWRSRFEDEILPRLRVWVAELDGAIVGFLALDIAHGYISQMFVDPSTQGTGIGDALMETAKEACPRGLTLHSLEQNARARRFWEKHGFLPGRASVNAVNGQPNIAYRWRPASMMGTD